MNMYFYNHHGALDDHRAMPVPTKYKPLSLEEHQIEPIRLVLN